MRQQREREEQKRKKKMYQTGLKNRQENENDDSVR